MSQPVPIIVAVDGPAGSGKSSVCARLADLLGWTYVNTGAIYRAVGVLVAKQDLDIHSEDELEPALQKIVRDLSWDNATRTLWYAGEELTADLRSATASKMASQIARIPMVRQYLMELQRRVAQQADRGAIVDGRDIGTVIFPDAQLKIFLTASLEERARRRHAELNQGKQDAAMAIDSVQADIASRDEQDANRTAAPLKMAADAVQIDTTDVALADVVQNIATLLRQRDLL